MYGRSYLAVAVGVLVLGILFQQPALTTLGLLSGMTLLIAWGWQAASLTGVTYERRFGEDHAFLGERVPLDVTITNFKLLPLSWLETDDIFPSGLQFVDYQPEMSSSPHYVIFGHTTAMRWFERVHWHYEVECSTRGLYRFGTVVLRSGDLFGLFTREEEQPAPARLYVYPKILDLPALGLPPRHPFGDLRAQRQLLEDPLRTAGVREYRPEDPFKRVHWKATARTQQLQVRLYEQTTTHTVMLFLNIESYEYIYEGVEAERAEWAIVVTASLARYAASQGWSFGLRSNAPAADGGEAVRLPPSHRPEQLTRLLEALARVLVYAVRGFTEVLRAETQSLPIGSTVIVISPVLTDALRGALLRLRERGLRVVVCALTDAPPEPLPGLLLYHLPPPADAPYLRPPKPPSLRTLFDDEAVPPGPLPTVAAIPPAGVGA